MRSETRVFFFGDSICFGQLISPHKSWVTRVAVRLDALGDELGRQITVQNPSVNGNTTRQALERMAYDVQGHEPDVLVIQFGMNDCNHWKSDRGHPRVSPAAFVANLEEMVERAYRFNVKQVVALTNHPSGRDRETMPFTTSTYEDANRRYNDLVRQVARASEGRVGLIDIEEAFRRTVGDNAEYIGEFLLSDNLHLSKRGHDLYFETVVPELENILTDTTGVLSAD